MIRQVDPIFEPRDPHAAAVVPPLVWPVRHLPRSRPHCVRPGLRIDPTTLLVGFWTVSVALCLAGVGAKLKYAWPAAALALGWNLIRNAPRHYVGFVWTLWFFTPMIRRMVDYAGHAFDPHNPCVLASPLVTGLCLVQLLKRSYLWRRPQVLPFLMILGGAAYAYARGVGEHGFFSPSYDALEWFVPPAFAAYLYLFREEIGPVQNALQPAFIAGVLVMGLYGLLQFLAPLPWDVFWMKQVDMASNGLPEPFKVRVFSTMNSPGPFSLIMMAGLLLVPAGKSFVRWVALGPGLVSILLSLVRAAWGGYAAGLLFVAARVTGKLKGRLLAIIAMLALVLLPLLTIGPVADQINNRVSSLQSVQNDDSFNVRVQIYIDSASMCLLNIPGAGLGSTGTSSKLQTADGKLGAMANFDSGLLNLPYVLGWPGSVLYLGGTLSLVLRGFKNRSLATDLFLCSSAAIVVGALGQMLFINTLIGVQGMVFWTFLGVCLAGTTTTTTATAAGPARHHAFHPRPFTPRSA